jgi:hypothetical protein
MENQTTTPAPVINVFGKEYCFQGAFEAEELEIIKKRWIDTGHSVMLNPKNSGNLYVTRFKTRKW